MKILITGGAGFIGSSLADSLLNEGNDIVVVDNFNDYYAYEIKEANVKHNLDNPHYHLYKIDLTDKNALKNVFAENNFDAVVHLAGRAGVRPSIERPEDYVESNILATIHILELMKDFNVKKLVFASSSSVYGNCKAQIFSEDLKVTEPISQYAATKSACEQFCYTYHKLYNMNIVCLRFFTVYGPRQRPDLAIHKFTDLISKHQPIPVFGDGTTKRDYTYIDDIISGVKAAIAYNKTPYEIINLGGGEPVSLSQMIKTIETTLGEKAIIDRKPMQKGDVDKTVSDISKAQRLLGYNPQTRFSDGIAKFIKWWKNK
ncbi:MAG: SDR family NAD(P)-dependent oxidoreductase [Azospirillum sp.]|nr:SDR family NAD(P)-dependent oxidoreductase [Azospirillum sp.]